MSYKPSEEAKLFLPFLDHALEYFGPSQIWWRGQASSESAWSLKPTVCRRPDADIIEQDFVNNFRRRALSRYRNCPPYADISSWIYLMQHYRLPTRLLDWSESILIAAYFAVNEKPDKPGVLWALSPSVLNDDQFGKRSIFNPDGTTMLQLIRPAFDKTAQNINKIGAVSSKEVDPRIMLQLSVFTIHGTCQPLDEMHNKEKYLLKFEISSDAKKRVGELLKDFGIRESIIFPDLDHLANEFASEDYQLFANL